MLFNCCVCVRVYLALQELTLEMNLIVERLSAVEERTEPKKHARSDEGITFLACLVCSCIATSLGQHQVNRCSLFRVQTDIFSNQNMTCDQAYANSCEFRGARSNPNEIYNFSKHPPSQRQDSKTQDEKFEDKL